MKISKITNACAIILFFASAASQAVFYHMQLWMDDAGNVVITLSDEHHDTSDLQLTIKQQDAVIAKMREYGFCGIFEDAGSYAGGNQEVIKAIAHYKKNAQEARKSHAKKSTTVIDASPLFGLFDSCSSSGLRCANAECRYAQNYGEKKFDITLQDVAEEIDATIKNNESYRSQDSEIQAIYNQLMVSFHSYEAPLDLIRKSAQEDPTQLFYDWYAKQRPAVQNRIYRFDAVLVDMNIIHDFVEQRARGCSRFVIAAGGDHIEKIEQYLEVLKFTRVDSIGTRMFTHDKPKDFIARGAELDIAAFFDSVVQSIKKKSEKAQE